jgi:FdhD protein
MLPIDETEQIKVLRITETERQAQDDSVVREYPLTIILNNQELVTLLCSPSEPQYLATGFLVSTGLLQNRSEIKNITYDQRAGFIRVDTNTSIAGNHDPRIFITSGCGRGTLFKQPESNKLEVTSQIKLDVTQILGLTKQFQQCSKLFKVTGGVHSAALCDHNKILLFKEDIGRHNAIDKIFGDCFLNNISTDDRIILTSGRVSSEIVLKVAKRNVPVLVSPSAPTDVGVRSAITFGMTLIGFVRGKRMNIYSGDWRLR